MEAPLCGRFWVSVCLCACTAVPWVGRLSLQIPMDVSIPFSGLTVFRELKNRLSYSPMGKLSDRLTLAPVIISDLLRRGGPSYTTSGAEEIDKGRSQPGFPSSVNSAVSAQEETEVSCLAYPRQGWGSQS